MDIDWDQLFPKPKRDDDREARKWRGALFWGFTSPVKWTDDEGYIESVKAPGSVTFPICQLCHHVIWEWPHFEEAVPQGACCEVCAKEEDEG